MATSLFHFDKMAIEIISLSDGKEGVAKAASFLYSEHMKDDSEICYRSEPDFTESDVANALKATGMWFHMVDSDYICILYFVLHLLRVMS